MVVRFSLKYPPPTEGNRERFVSIIDLEENCLEREIRD
jgi:hypothetical protein